MAMGTITLVFYTDDDEPVGDALESIALTAANEVLASRSYIHSVIAHGAPSEDGFLPYLAGVCK